MHERAYYVFGGKKKKNREGLKSTYNLLDSLNYGYFTSVSLLFGLLALTAQYNDGTASDLLSFFLDRAWCCYLPNVASSGLL